ncbi:MAG: hydantoinase B/oxoprolinase family protein [Geminicoccaceae bacterium]|nr:MAG: hydantoinase B/oxoprolinase family protein [Geminicoccaceae bacterium]
MTEPRLLRDDPVTFEVIRQGLLAICEEMKSVLMRAAFSPLLSLSADLSCAVLDHAGEVAAQGHDIPVHLGAMPFTGRSVLRAFPAHLWRPGDAVLTNDPYEGGTHLPDMSVLSPVFVDGRLTAFAASRVHWPDVGGAAAGSSSITDDIVKEGLRLRPIRIVEAGTVRQDLLELILDNVRVPADRLGDFRAQLAANARGVARLAGMGQRYGGAVLRQVIAETQVHGRLAVRQRLARLPDADVSHAEALDGDGYGGEDLGIAVRITKQGDTISFDFTGTAPAARGPVNAPLPVTASAVYYTLLGFLGGDIQPGSGAYGVARIVAPEGSLVHARPPVPVVAANTETSNRIVDILLGALAQAYPDRVPAGSYGSAAVYTLGGFDPIRGRRFVHYETVGGGGGARFGHDGASGLRVHMGNTMNLPIEALEAQLPIRFDRYALIPESGGEGRWQGGQGVHKAFTVLADDVQCSILGERTHAAAAGVAGGGAGRVARFGRRDRDGSNQDLAAKSGPHRLCAGDRIDLFTAGGGGWGRRTASEGNDR